MNKLRKYTVAVTGLAIVLIAWAVISTRHALAQGGCPVITLPGGACLTPLAGGFFAHANFKIKVKEPIEIGQDNLKFAPNTDTGWHFHPGTAFVIVKRGEVTVDHADCFTVHAAGSAFMENEGDIHRVRNASSSEAEIFGTLILPAGSPPVDFDVPPLPTPTRVCQRGEEKRGEERGEER